MDRWYNFGSLPGCNSGLEIFIARPHDSESLALLGLDRLVMFGLTLSYYIVDNGGTHSG